MTGRLVVPFVIKYHVTYTWLRKQVKSFNESAEALTCIGAAYLCDRSLSWKSNPHLCPQIRIWESHLCRRRDATVIGHRRFRNHHPRKVCLLSCLLFPSVQFRRLLGFCLWRIFIKKLGSNWVLGLIHLADHHMLSICLLKCHTHVGYAMAVLHFLILILATIWAFETMVVVSFSRVASLEGWWQRASPGLVLAPFCSCSRSLYAKSKIAQGYTGLYQELFSCHFPWF